MGSACCSECTNSVELPLFYTIKPFPIVHTRQREKKRILVIFRKHPECNKAVDMLIIIGYMVSIYKGRVRKREGDRERRGENESGKNEARNLNWKKK